ncbi:cytochrome P450 [Myxosarcina sp. GI1(2024)]
MSQIKRDRSLDSTLGFLSQGYTFISRRCERYQSDIFETRLRFQKAICIRGEEAARMFYESGRFTRKGAIPPTALMLLQDKGSVQTLDGQAHYHRKQMFMALMSEKSRQQLAHLMVEQWHRQLAKWVTMDLVLLHPEVQEILCRSACEWAGIPLSESEAKERTREFAAMIDGSGSIGPRNWWGLLLRTRTERWGRRIIDGVRSERLAVPEGSAVDITAGHRNLERNLLDRKIAAVELINFLRSTVAIARYITFAALALYEYPECREKLLSGDEDYTELFIQEVRRFYPFFPAVGGHVKQEFDWRGYHFTKGTWVLLDIYGTNRDPRIWEAADTFKPERFRDWNHSAYNFIPQRGGDHYYNHRCAGEWLTIELTKTAVHLLTHTMSYNVPRQDLTLNLSRLPTIPKSRFAIDNVQSK